MFNVHHFRTGRQGIFTVLIFLGNPWEILRMHSSKKVFPLAAFGVLPFMPTSILRLFFYDFFQYIYVSLWKGIGCFCLIWSPMFFRQDLFSDSNTPEGMLRNSLHLFILWALCLLLQGIGEGVSKNLVMKLHIFIQCIPYQVLQCRIEREFFCNAFK